MDTKPEDLKKAYKKEKDARIKVRMIAVSMVVFNNQSIAHTANLLMQSADWVSLRVMRFGEEGLEAPGPSPYRTTAQNTTQKYQQNSIKNRSHYHAKDTL